MADEKIRLERSPVAIVRLGEPMEARPNVDILKKVVEELGRTAVNPKMVQSDTVVATFNVMAEALEDYGVDVARLLQP